MLKINRSRQGLVVAFQRKTLRYNKKVQKIKMKRIGNLYEKITNIDNITMAIQNAAKGKKRRKKVYDILKNLEQSAAQLQNMLINENYIPSPYNKSIIKDGKRQKERIIHKPQYFPDQCIHWCVIQIIENILQRRNV